VYYRNTRHEEPPGAAAKQIAKNQTPPKPERTAPTQQTAVNNQ
jgi:hypothetical protein